MDSILPPHGLYTISTSNTNPPCYFSSSIFLLSRLLTYIFLAVSDDDLGIDPMFVQGSYSTLLCIFDENAEAQNWRTCAYSLTKNLNIFYFQLKSTFQALVSSSLHLLLVHTRYLFPSSPSNSRMRLIYIK